MEKEIRKPSQMGTRGIRMIRKVRMNSSWDANSDGCDGLMWDLVNIEQELCNQEAEENK